VLLKNGDQAVDFRMAALAVKPFRMAANIVAMQAVQYFVARQLHHEVIGDNKKAVGQVFSVFAKQHGGIRSLEIFGWRLNNF
jgi:hypothetical protein